MSRKKNTAAAAPSAEPAAVTPPVDLPPPPPVGSFELVSRHLVRAAPWNPRKHFDPDALQELADSIRTQGLAEPILLRPLGTGHYELVAGERRFRACELVDLDPVPAIVRTLTDEQAFDVALVENGQRRDLHPLEEADAFAVKRDRFHRSVEEIAAQVGHTTLYVRQRIRLADLEPTARQLFLDAKVSLGVALLLARMPNPKQQAKAAQQFGDRRGDELLSVSQARWTIEREFMLDLKRATFPLADATLVPEAGACSTCPKRTGNQRELFDDVESDDLCTDSACFEGKVDAAWKRQVDEAKKSGVRMLSQTEAKAIWKDKWSGGDLKKAGFTDLNATCYEDSKHRTYKQLLKDTKPTAIVRHPHSGTVVELIEAKGLTKLLKAAGHDFSKKSSGGGGGGRTSSAASSWHKKQEAERRAKDRKKKVVAAALAQMAPAIEKGAADKAYLRLLVDAQLDENLYRLQEVFRRRDQKDRNPKKLAAYVAGLTEGQLRALLLEMAIGDGIKGYGNAYGSAFLGACKVFKVDVKKLEAAELAKDKAAAKPAKGKKAAPAKKGGKKPKASPAGYPVGDVDDFEDDEE